MRSDVIHVLVALVSMRLAVSFKYAFMTPSIYRSRLRVWAPWTQRIEEQLISGWMVLNRAVVTREVRAAVSLRHPDAGAAGFVLHAAALPQLRATLGCVHAVAVIDAALAEAAAAAAVCAVPGAAAAAAAAAAAPAAASAPVGCARAAAPLRIPVIVLAEALILAASLRVAGYTRWTQRFLILVALVGTFTTTIVRAAFGVPVLGYDALDRVVIIGHWIANVTTMGLTFLFLSIGAVDHRRRAESHALLGQLCSPGTLGSRVRAPVLALDSTEQAHAFIAARGVLIEFGEAYHDRLVLVVSASLVMFALMGGYCLVALFASSAGDLGPLITAFILLHVLVLPAFLCCGLGLNEAARANSAAHAHVAVVINARVRARLADDDPADGGAAEARGPLDARVLGLLTDIEHALRAQDDDAPITILSHSATGGLTQSFLGLWMSIETVAISVFATTLYNRAMKP